MPPKGGGGASKKTVEKQKNKIVEDKTFGLKNKNKSAKVDKYVKQVTNQVKGKNDKDFVDQKARKAEEERKKLEADLFKPAVNQTKAPPGVDPKSVVCEFFKAGACTKGAKCKFSHDLGVARKSEKIDIYTDRRTLEEDTMDTWDQSKLEEVVKKKENANKTAIVCKYFLEAIENKKYGWFWECPNGGDKCMYQHALPPGFVLKTKETKLEDEEEELLEDVLEQEKAKLTTRTPLTLDLFLKWKEDKKKEKEKEKDEKLKTDAKAKEQDRKALKSGRALFIYNPDLFQDDEDAVDISDLPIERDEGPVIELDVSGTSIRATVRNAGKEEGEANEEEGEGIKEELFVDDDVPDISDDEEEGK